MNDDANDILNEFRNKRKANIQKYKCPMCGNKNWLCHDDTFILPKPGAFIVPSSYWECRGYNDGHVIRFDCADCGFVALFALGRGPS